MMPLYNQNDNIQTLKETNKEIINVQRKPREYRSAPLKEKKNT